jgi:hypothetical protein
MQIIQVGPDKVWPSMLAEIQPVAIYDWFIYWFESDMYSGEGIGAVLRNDSGGVKWASLGYDSCCEPLVGGFKGAPEVSLKKFLTFGEFCETVPDKKREPDDFDYARWQAIIAKAKELSSPA